jgi:hypothetical protein
LIQFFRGGGSQVIIWGFLNEGASNEIASRQVGPRKMGDF